MTGPKLNEGALLIPEGQPSIKATAKYLRGSASKAREVLDLIRGLDVRRADEVLQFTTRDVAKDVRKVLASAVANAVHNEGQDAEELFVLAAFADEGPTLKRFKARARGRGTRIRKRTSHITVVVARLSDDRLEVLQNKQQTQTAAGRRRAGTSAQGRRDRVQRSRARAEGLREGTAETVDTDVETPASDADVVDGQEILAAEVEEEAAEASEAQGFADIDTDAETDDADTVEQGEAGDEGAEPSTEASEASPSVDVPAGAVAAPADGSIPEGYPVKGNASSQMYHVPGGRYYDITIAEVFFDSPESAEAAGYEAPAADKDDA